jgi:hypothetical protein
MKKLRNTTSQSKKLSVDKKRVKKSNLLMEQRPQEKEL